MSDVDDRLAERRATEERMRQQLTAMGYDGPYDITQGGIFGGIGDSVRYAICLTCAAMVRLDDPEEQPDGPPIERSIRIHGAWHDTAATPVRDE